MKYEIMGGNLPAVICKLSEGEKIICESGGMSWMDGVFKMETSAGGLGKAFGRMFSGESAFTNVYTAEQDGEIAFASCFPGEILAVELTPGKSIIAQKKAFLAAEAGVEMSVFFQKSSEKVFSAAKALLWKSSQAAVWYSSRLTAQSESIRLLRARKKSLKQVILL